MNLRRRTPSAYLEHLRYDLGAEVVLTYGAGNTSFIEHDEHPLVVSGVLGAAGTPADRTMHVGLPGMDAIHCDMAVDHGRASADPLADGQTAKD